MELFDLVEKYGTDKNLSSYTPIYEDILSFYKELPISLLEIGIGSLDPEVPSSFFANLNRVPEYTPGGSLRVWRDYFKKGQIYGGDVAEDCMFREERITTFLFDSTNREECDKQLGGLKFNIIIDDGLHLKEAQLSTITNLWSRLLPGGIYIIEDISGPHEFREQTIPRIKWVIDDDAIISRNNRQNMIFIKKYKIHE